MCATVKCDLFTLSANSTYVAMRFAMGASVRTAVLLHTLSLSLNVGSYSRTLVGRTEAAVAFLIVYVVLIGYDKMLQA